MTLHAPLRLLLAAAVVAVVALALGRGGAGQAAEPVAMVAGGALSQLNSKDGSAILSASGMGPGDSAEGTVTVGNTGTVDGAFALSHPGVQDSPGTGGGALSTRLRLVVEDVTAPQPALVYSGEIAGMPAIALGTFRPGEERTYRFTVSFPDGGDSGDDAYQGAAMSVQYDWTLSDAPPPAPEPDPTPAAPEPAQAPQPASQEEPGGAGEQSELVTGSQPQPPPARSGLRVRVRVPRRQDALRRRHLRLRVSCSRSCRLTVRARYPRRLARRHGLRGSRISRKVRRRATVRIWLSRDARGQIHRRLRRGRQFPLRVRITARDGRGGSVAVTRTLRLRRSR